MRSVSQSRSDSTRKSISVEVEEPRQWHRQKLYRQRQYQHHLGWQKRWRGFIARGQVPLCDQDRCQKRLCEAYAASVD